MDHDKITNQADCKIVIDVLNRYYSHVNDMLRGELESAGYLGLARAEKTFKSGLGRSKTSHLYAGVHHAMQDTLRQYDYLTRGERKLVEEGHECFPSGRRKGEIIDLGHPIPLDTNWWGNNHPAKYDHASEIIEFSDLYWALNQLPPRWQMVIRCVDLLDWKMTDVAELFDIGESRVCQIRRKALERMRDLMTDYEETG